ncbi:MAG: leucine-rich repeat protein, partial [Bacillota bacterium]|nr:leucine-rich repeat protein [Bacillota bacterium]
KLVHFEIPESVTRIGDDSFRSTAITSARIPEGVKTIGQNAFRFCRDLESVEFAEGLETIEFYAFEGCSSLTKIELPGTVKKLRTCCFNECPNLTDVTLNDGLEIIEDQVFHGGKYLRNLYLPSSLTSFSQNCFGDQTIHVWREGDSPAITAENVIVHNGITRSEYEFFSAGSINYGYVQIPDEITDIPSNAMPDYGDIIELAIPSTVASFADDALSERHWKRIQKVYYEGTEEEFAALGLSEVLAHAQIVYDIDLDHFKNVGDLTIEYDAGPYTYNGEAIEPEVTVKDGDTIITEGQDYTIRYENNIQAGSGSIYITAKGTSYYGEVRKEFRIDRMTDVSEIQISEVPDQEYTGRLITPAVTVSYKGNELTLGYDYVVYYENNIDEGQATINVWFIGRNINGSKTSSFNIVKTDTEGKNYGYKVEITAFGQTDTTYHLVGDAVTITAPAETGYKFLSWAAEGSAASFFADQDLTSSELSFHMPTQDLALTVNYEKNIEAAELDGFKDQLVYNGKARKQTMNVMWNGTKLTEGTDYTIAYTNNKAVGTATVTLTAAGDFRGTLTKTYQIIPKGTKAYKLKKGKKALTVRWKKIKTKMNKTRITGYQIQYATDKEFTQEVQSVDVKGYKKSSKKIKNLAPKTRYYVHVRTFKTVNGETYYSNWTKVKYAKTK